MEGPKRDLTLRGKSSHSTLLRPVSELEALCVAAFVHTPCTESVPHDVAAKRRCCSHLLGPWAHEGTNERGCALLPPALGFLSHLLWPTCVQASDHAQSSMCPCKFAWSFIPEALPVTTFPFNSPRTTRYHRDVASSVHVNRQHRSWFGSV